MSNARRRIVLAAIGALSAGSVSAQQYTPPLDPNAEIVTRQLRPGLAVLTGGGGNIGVWHGRDGIVIVDDNLAPLAPRVIEAVARLAEGPVRFVINTHWHPDHTGGNEAFGRTGGIIIAHDKVRTRMAEAQFIEAVGMQVPAAPPAALPIVTFDDSVTLYLNGDRLEVIHVIDAHTDGDAVLWWQAANVVHTGDVYLSNSYPFVDLSSGGTLAGLMTAIEAVLARANDATIVIPGHGPISNRRELSEYRDMLVTIGRRIRESVEQGRSLEEVIGSHPTAEFDERYGQGFMTPARFVGVLYRDLATPTPGLRPAGRN